MLSSTIAKGIGGGKEGRRAQAEAAYTESSMTTMKLVILWE